jgi:lipoate-protein ligase A
MRDAKLPYAREAKKWLENHGYTVIVRNSGGTAVLLDEGILNVSLIFPEEGE